MKNDEKLVFDSFICILIFSVITCGNVFFILKSKLIFTVIFNCFCILPFIVLFFRKKCQITAFELLLYSIISLQFLIQTTFTFTDYILKLLLCVSPYILLCSTKDKVPLAIKIATGLMLIGMVLTFLYNVLTGSGDFITNFFDNLQLLSYLNFIFIVLYFYSKNLMKIDNVLKAIIISGAIFISYVFYLYVSQSFLTNLLYSRFGMSVNVNPNIISIYLDLIFPIALFVALNTQKTVEKTILLVLSAIIGICIILTSSRGSLPGLLIIAVFFLIKKRAWIFSMILISSASVVGIIFGDKLLQRIFHPKMDDLMSDLGRLQLLKSAWSLLSENYFLFGIGFNSFRNLKFEYGFPTWFDRQHNMSSHNLFLEIWLGWGLFGLLGWLFLLGSIVFLQFKIKNRDNFLWGLFFSLIAFSIHNAFDSMVANPGIMFVVIIIIATYFFHYSQLQKSTGTIAAK